MSTGTSPSAAPASESLMDQIRQIPTMDSATQQLVAGNFVTSLALNAGVSQEDPQFLNALASATGADSADLSSVSNQVVQLAIAGRVPYLYVTAAGTLTASTKPIPPPNDPQASIALEEIFALTSFWGDFGAGKTVSTFTLLPGEETTISVSTYKNSETNSQQASSVLDSYSQETSDEFASSTQSENSDSDSVDNAQSWYFDAKASANANMGVWGASISADGGAKGSTDSKNTEFTKNVNSATDKHTAKASAQRNVQVNTSFQVTEQSGEQTSTTRTIKNVNVGRVLNFVFRQLNQEYWTILHLIDVRVVAHAWNTTREYSLGELEDFISQWISPNVTETDPFDDKTKPVQDIVREMILYQLTQINDYDGRLLSLIEFVDFPDPVTGKTSSGKTVEDTSYTVQDYLNDHSSQKPPKSPKNLRVRVQTGPLPTPPPSQSGSSTTPSVDQIDPNASVFAGLDDSGPVPEVSGIIMSVTKRVMPTDAVIVDALLGQADALDEYSLQSRQAVIDMKRAHIDRANLANSIISSNNTQEGQLYSQMFPKTSKVEGTEVEVQASSQGSQAQGS